MKLVFCPDPDPGSRFGHQTTILLSAAVFADFFDGFFVSGQLTGRSSSFNKVLDLSKSSYHLASHLTFKNHCDHSPLSYLSSQEADINQLPQTFDMSTTAECKKFVRIISHYQASYKNYCIAKLARDQYCGLFGKLVARKPHRLSKDLSNTFNNFYLASLVGSYLSRECIENGTPYISFHLRRGDISAASHPAWVLSLAVIESVLDALTEVIPSGFGLIIFTQGQIESEIQHLCDIYSSGHAFCRIHTTSQLHSNDLETEAFALMSQSIFLISSISSFSGLSILPRQIPHMQIISDESLFLRSIFSTITISPCDPFLYGKIAGFAEACIASNPRKMSAIS